MASDIKSLSKSIINVESPDIVDLLAITVPEITPKSLSSLDQIRFEPYVRLKALPDDVRRLVAVIIAANEISSRVVGLVPSLTRAEPTYYPSGIAELQWKMDDSSVFGLILSNYYLKLTEENGKISIEKSIKIGWRFHGPHQYPQSGEFKSLDEALDFISKSFVV